MQNFTTDLSTIGTAFLSLSLIGLLVRVFANGPGDLVQSQVASYQWL